MAVDASGDLYIANTDASNIIELAPPYTKLKRTLKDPGYYPLGVAVCKGYVAVTNIYSTSSGNGNVEIYAGTATSPSRTLTDPNSAREYFDTCDNLGNLFTSYCIGSPGSGCNGAGGSVNEWKLGKGAPVELSNVVTGFPGGLDWEDGSLFVDDQNNSTVGIWPSPYTSVSKTILLKTSQDPVTIHVLKNDLDMLAATCCAPAVKIGAAEYSLSGSSGAFDHGIKIPIGSASPIPIGVTTNTDDGD